MVTGSKIGIFYLLACFTKLFRENMADDELKKKVKQREMSQGNTLGHMNDTKYVKCRRMT